MTDRAAALEASIGAAYSKKDDTVKTMDSKHK